MYRFIDPGNGETFYIVKVKDNRCCFKSKRAPAIVWDKFIGHWGKLLTKDGMKHIENPIRYWNV